MTSSSDSSAAMRALSRMTQAGFTLALEGNALVVSPADRLNEQQRAFIRTHKPALVQLLVDAGIVAESRARFAALAPELQTAMKRAARVEGWDEAQWIDETGIVSEIIRNGDYSPEVIRTATAIYAAIGAPS